MTKMKLFDFTHSHPLTSLELNIVVSRDLDPPLWCRLSLSNATRALIIGEWETQVQFVLTDHPNNPSQEHSTLHIARPSKDPPLTPSSTLHSAEDEHHLLQVVAISHWSVFLSQINKWKFVPLVRALVILCEIWAKILRCASSLISRGWSNI